LYGNIKGGDKVCGDGRWKIIKEGLVKKKPESLEKTGNPAASELMKSGIELG